MGQLRSSTTFRAISVWVLFLGINLAAVDSAIYRDELSTKMKDFQQRVRVYLKVLKRKHSLQELDVAKKAVFKDGMYFIGAALAAIGVGVGGVLFIKSFRKLDAKLDALIAALQREDRSEVLDLLCKNKGFDWDHKVEGGKTVRDLYKDKMSKSLEIDIQPGWAVEHTKMILPVIDTGASVILNDQGVKMSEINPKYLTLYPDQDGKFPFLDGFKGLFTSEPEKLEKQGGSTCYQFDMEKFNRTEQ